MIVEDNFSNVYNYNIDISIEKNVVRDFGGDKK